MTAKSDIRSRLREATAAAHERLHRHPGFAAVAAGTIGLGDYRLLLSRLWGFHRAFERVFGEADRQRPVGAAFAERARSPMLEADLVALGLGRDSIKALPQCESLSPPRGTAEFMGALYVVEGSTLGGVHLARALEPLVPSASGEGRRFFIGYGNAHSAMWRSFLARLDAVARSEADKAAVIDGAMRTFSDFEIWMDGWSAPPQTKIAPLLTEVAR